MGGVSCSFFFAELYFQMKCDYSTISNLRVSTYLIRFTFSSRSVNGKTGLFKTFKLKNAFSYFIEEVPSVDPTLQLTNICVCPPLPNGVPFVSRPLQLGGMA